MTDFLSLAAEGGFSHCAPLCMAAAVPRREVRGMCAADRCGKWGRCWSCPPACGTLEQAASRIARFDRGILVQSTAKLADDFDYDGIQALSRTHARRFAALARQMRLLCTRTLPLSAGPCLVCRRCTCPDRPCRYPSRRISILSNSVSISQWLTPLERTYCSTQGWQVLSSAKWQMKPST